MNAFNNKQNVLLLTLFFLIIDFVFLMYISTGINNKSSSTLPREKNTKNIKIINQPYNNRITSLEQNTMFLRDLTTTIMNNMENRLGDQSDQLEHRINQFITQMNSKTENKETQHKKTKIKNRCATHIVSIKKIRDFCVYSSTPNTFNFQSFENVQRVKNTPISTYAIENRDHGQKIVSFCFKMKSERRNLEEILNAENPGCAQLYMTKMDFDPSDKFNQRNDWNEKYNELLDLLKDALNFMKSIDFSLYFKMFWDNIHTQVVIKIKPYLIRVEDGMCEWMEVFLMFCFIKKISRTNKLFMR